MKIDDGTRQVLLAMAEQLIASRPADEVICRHDNPFFERWYMLRKAPGAIENAYIHRFLRSDREELHDHPWDNQSIVLRGAYVEKWEHPALGLIQSPRLAGEIVSRGPEAVHSIYSVEPGTISLFTTGPKVREWGFITADGWIHNTKFRAWKSAREAA